MLVAAAPGVDAAAAALAVLLTRAVACRWRRRRRRARGCRWRRRRQRWVGRCWRWRRGDAGGACVGGVRGDPAGEAAHARVDARVVAIAAGRRPPPPRDDADEHRRATRLLDEEGSTAVPTARVAIVDAVDAGASVRGLLAEVATVVPAGTSVGAEVREEGVAVVHRIERHIEVTRLACLPAISVRRHAPPSHGGATDGRLAVERPQRAVVDSHAVGAVAVARLARGARGRAAQLDESGVEARHVVARPFRVQDDARRIDDVGAVVIEHVAVHLVLVHADPHGREELHAVRRSEHPCRRDQRASAEAVTCLEVKSHEERVLELIDRRASDDPGLRRSASHVRRCQRQHGGVGSLTARRRSRKTKIKTKTSFVC